MAARPEAVIRARERLARERRQAERLREPGGLLVVREGPLNAETPRAALRSFLTPAGARFLRANFAIPALSPRTHAVEVGGGVRQPFTLRLADLRAMPQRTATVTTECAGNHRTSMVPLPPGEPWQGGAVSTGRWTGVPLAAVLEKAGLPPECIEVLVSGADRGQTAQGEPSGYDRSLPRAKALDPDVLLALELDGRPIAPSHGGPVRLVVPGWYGMASVKWVERIEALEAPFRGYFQAERYVYRLPGQAPEPVAEMRVKSIFVSPAPSARVRVGPLRVRGLAWSGSAPVARVEVALAGGGMFAEAKLLGEPVAHAWRRWELIWTPSHRGRHVLRCRATDALGNTQPGAPAWNELGYGANGVQSLLVEVR
jgi:DMSO/TMAO reductase YedYZ molybdopterin-dependent catalytic subunit